MCQCGCKGRCTYNVIMSWLRWSFGVVAAGAWPRTRHDGAPFGEEERFRLEQSDKRFPHKSMIMFLKGDWVEFSERLGYPLTPTASGLASAAP